MKILRLLEDCYRYSSIRVSESGRKSFYLGRYICSLMSIITVAVDVFSRQYMYDERSVAIWCFITCTLVRVSRGADRWQKGEENGMCELNSHNQFRPATKAEWMVS